MLNCVDNKSRTEAMKRFEETFEVVHYPVKRDQQKTALHQRDVIGLVQPGEKRPNEQRDDYREQEAGDYPQCESSTNETAQFRAVASLSNVAFIGRVYSLVRYQ